METNNNKKPKAVYNPGELDRTRKNIGDVDKDEAARLSKLLGGEVGTEKTPAYDNPVIKKTKQHIVRSGSSSASSIGSGNGSSSAGSSSHSGTSDGGRGADGNSPVRQTGFQLPVLGRKEKVQMFRLMSHHDFQIKPAYSFFGLILAMARGSLDKVNEEYITVTLPSYLAKMQSFITSVRQVVYAADDSFKTKVSHKSDQFYAILQFIFDMKIDTAQELLSKLQKEADSITVNKLVPFTKEMYRLILPLYYYGESNMTQLLKKTYILVTEKPVIPTETTLKHVKDAAQHFLFINGQIVKGMYPLLLRMCSSSVIEYPEFFTSQASRILQLLELTKYDIFLPVKNNRDQSGDGSSNESGDAAETETDTRGETSSSGGQADAANSETDENSESAENEKTPHSQKVNRDEQNAAQAGGRYIPPIVRKGLEILDRMFPQAGWLELHNHPDMYPYFQPLYSFKDGFNMIAPQNPVQIVVVLIRIIEDFFQGCRHIKFSIDKEPDFSAAGDDTGAVFSQWSLYREIVYERLYAAELKDYVNHEYTQPDFRMTIFAKKQLSNMMWKAKYYFLPFLSFELLFMEKPDKDETYVPLPRRTEYIKSLFTELISRIDSYTASSTHGTKDLPDLGATNITDLYRFDVPNIVSRRLDVFLGGKKSHNTTNLNMLKYCAGVIAVLDWWINDETSPAYDFHSQTPYRVSPENGQPVFTVPLRADQNELFIRAARQRSLIAKKQAEAQESAGTDSEAKTEAENKTAPETSEAVQ